ncbi:hypothetical protein [Mesorhizobium sp.]|uniref:hypothetical protein n=1 Tax=Mesorhizobium sp. TaxID=1871066 RepID=UPI00345D8CA9
MSLSPFIHRDIDLALDDCQARAIIHAMEGPIIKRARRPPTGAHGNLKGMFDMKPGLLEEVPWSDDSMTVYDKENYTIYLQILDACADNATIEEMAELILGIDPALEPVRARNAVRSHIDRANWMVTTGSKHLFAG